MPVTALFSRLNRRLLSSKPFPCLSIHHTPNILHLLSGNVLSFALHSNSTVPAIAPLRKKLLKKSPVTISTTSFLTNNAYKYN